MERFNHEKINENENRVLEIISGPKWDDVTGG
jgi:hypothetical protein